MEAASEAEEKKKKKPLEAEVKTKRKMKTASQLEILEKTYAGFFFVCVCSFVRFISVVFFFFFSWFLFNCEFDVCYS